MTSGANAKVPPRHLQVFMDHLHQAGYPDLALDPAHPYKTLSGGISRTTIRLHCLAPDGEKVDFVVSVQNQHRPVRNETVLAVQQAMVEAGVPTPPPIGGAGALPGTGQHFKIKPAICGHHGNNLTDDQIKQAGAILADIHIAGAGMEKTHDFSKNPLRTTVLGKDPQMLRLFASRTVAAVVDGSGPDWKKLCKRIYAAEYKAELDPNIPKGVLHGDPNPRNFLVDENGKVHIIDWENCHVGPYIRELARAVYQLASRMDETGHRFFDQRAANLLIESYNEHRPLSELERRQFGDILRENIGKAEVLEPLMHRFQHRDDWRRIGEDVTSWLQTQPTKRLASDNQVG